MRVRSLLSVLVTCSAAYGCTIPTNEPVAAPAQSRSDPEVRTGTRLPGNNSGMTGSVSKDDWQNQRSREGASGVPMK